MTSNVGLTTPRGSGTSGYVQRNLSFVKPLNNYAPYPQDYESLQKHKQRKPDKQILDHDRLREIEVKVFDLRDKLEEEGIDEEEIEVQTEALRNKLSEPSPTASRDVKRASRAQFKPHQVHEQAAAKIEESEKLRKALGIRSDYEEGGHWRRGEERLRFGVSEIKAERREDKESPQTSL